MLQLKTLRGQLALCAVSACLALSASAQTPTARALAPTTSVSKTATTTAATSNSGDSPSAASDMEEVRRQLREQQEELERMRALITEQSSVINELRQRVEQSAPAAGVVPGVIKTGDLALSDSTALAASDSPQTPAAAKPQNDTDARLGKVEAEVKKTSETLARQLGSITFSGDVRFRWESFYGQLNGLTNADNPVIVGNPVSTRQRFRIRARLNIRGQLGKEFDWGLRLTTGSFADTISGNQTVTDFFNRKPFGLDNVYIGWTPERVPGLRIQAGKFEAPWLRTEMTFDNDVNPEGVAEIYTRNFKSSALKQIYFAAWQLPFLERTSAFVRNPNGTVNLDESGRGGRDLALYGGQLRARIEPSKTFGLTLAVSDLFYSGTEFISPIQFFGTQLQLPVTINIPASATTPAQTVTTQVSIPRDLFVSGNGNLGVSVANTNAVNRDGRLASGFNLIDLIARLDLTRSKRWPVALIFDFVHNTQAHDVSVAGPGGATLFLENKENNGYWAEIQVGKNRERGDLFFDYAFIRIEKDAVLTGFNYSDLFQPSDMLTHRLTFAYTADPHVVITLTSFFGRRPNGLLGVFGATPPGSLNVTTTRLQFDTTFRF